MKFGYVRVSTVKQKDGYSLDDQRSRLLDAGVEERNIFEDVGSGKDSNRNSFQDLLTRLRDGDEVYVVKLDRFGRNYSELISLVSEFKEKNIVLKSLNDGLDTSTQMGEAMLYMAGIFAEMERSLIAERTKAGIKRAKEDGVKFGRPSKSDKALVNKAKRFYESGMIAKDAAQALGVSRAHYYKLLKM